jgi:hypothetical protein
VRKLAVAALAAALAGPIAVTLPAGVASAAPTALPDPITGQCPANDSANCWRYITFSDNQPPDPNPPAVAGSRIVLNDDAHTNIGNGVWWNTPVTMTGNAVSVSFNAYLEGGDPSFHGSGMAFALVDSYMQPAPIPYFPTPLNFGASGPGLGFNGFHGDDVTPGAPNPEGTNNLAVTLVTDDDDDWDNGNDQTSNFNLSRVGLLHGRSWDEVRWQKNVHQRLGSWYPDSPKDVAPSIYGGRAVPVSILLVPNATPGKWNATVVIDGATYYDKVLVDLPPSVYLGFTSGVHERPEQHAISDVTVRYGPVEVPTVTASPNPANLGQVHVGSTSVPAPITITNTGFVPATVSLGPTPAGFAVAGLPVTLPPGASAVLNTTFTPSTTGPAGGNVRLEVASALGSGASLIAVSGTGVPPGTSIGAPFSALPPTRILDTRQSGGPVGPGAVRSVPVAGMGGVPANAGAVVMNVTVDQPTAAGYVTVYPTGQPTPRASNLNFVAGKTIANLVTAKIGPDGSVSIYNFAGQTNVLFDVVGWFPDTNSGSASGFSATAAQGGEFVPLAPVRVLDTRVGAGAAKAPLGPGGQIDVQIEGAGPVPATGVAAVVMNLTGTNTTAAGYLTAWPTGAARQTTSNLNFVGGQSVPNLAVIPVGAGGQVSIYNFAGNTDVIGDVVGYYTDPGVSVPGGSLFHPMAPERFLDTRPEFDHATLADGQTVSTQIAGRAGIPADAVGVVANVTATNTTVPGFLTVFPDALPQPLTSSLNFVGGEPGVPNLVMSKLGAPGNISIFDYSPGGTTDAIVDVVGYYAAT